MENTKYKCDRCGEVVQEFPKKLEECGDSFHSFFPEYEGESSEFLININGLIEGQFIAFQTDSRKVANKILSLMEHIEEDEKEK